VTWAAEEAEERGGVGGRGGGEGRSGRARPRRAPIRASRRERPDGAAPASARARAHRARLLLDAALLGAEHARRELRLLGQLRVVVGVVVVILLAGATPAGQGARGGGGVGRAPGMASLSR
jgi:uncharacterized protein YjeT (DUF2065 family)